MSTAVTTNKILVEHATAIRTAAKRTVKDIVEIGWRLTEAKKLVGHGNWLPWLEREFGWTEQTALNFMRLHELGQSNSKRVLDLNLPVSSLYLLAAPSTPEEARNEVIERVEAGEPVTVAEVKETIGRARPVRAEAGEEVDESSEDEDLGASRWQRAPRRTPEQIRKEEFCDSISVVLNDCKCAGRHGDDLTPMDIPSLTAAERKEMLQGIKKAITALERLHERIKKAS
jgi:antitoxin (DNA-binding transcriptional repressor) of toxin-antitoxin stability system